MKICQAPGCGFPQFGGGYCRNHQYLRKDGKSQGKIKKQRFNEKFEYDNPHGFASETEMYKYILRTRGSRSFISRADIKFPKPINFAHVLPKGIGQYPHFRFNPKYCILVTAEEHNLIDNGTDDRRKEHGKKYPWADWEKFYQLRKEAKEEYERKYND